jgi:DNA integrity scanning protein DisA with diadenylate cyclase activity
MLKTILSPLTTATSVGVFLRYLTTIISSVLTILSIIGWLTPEQVRDIGEKVRLITAQLPELLTAISGLALIIVTTYHVHEIEFRQGGRSGQGDR